MDQTEHCDIVIIGGGFYGCCLATHLKKKNNKVILVEKESELMTRSSAINQARVHTGFHYPRSFVTAFRSLINLPRFVLEFQKAIVDDFTMLYAIARNGSKVSAKRFHTMFKEMKAPIRPASSTHKDLFNSNLIEDVFQVKEYAFDYKILREILKKQMSDKNIYIRLNTRVHRCKQSIDNKTDIELTNGTKLRSTYVFNCTYSMLNNLLDSSNAKLLPLKHEVTEVALIKPPAELHKIGITVMDGPFFSTMPFPAENCYSLTHVRYTPHKMWTDGKPCIDGHDFLLKSRPPSKFQHMRQDSVRYLPCLQNCEYVDSLFEIKTVLIKNESDDGRPIMLHHNTDLGNMYSILGGKIDNVFDLFEFLGQIKDEFK